MKARAEVVERLCHGATAGMLTVGQEEKDLDPSDVFCAYMTLALRAILYARDRGGDLDAIRGAIQAMWAEVTEEGRVH